jgi:hypothetical protein
MKIDRLLYACTQDTGVLISAREWLEEERNLVLERLMSAEDEMEIFRLQGEARALRRLATVLGQKARIKSGPLELKPRFNVKD